MLIEIIKIFIINILISGLEARTQKEPFCDDGKVRFLFPYVKFTKGFRNIYVTFIFISL